MAADRFAVIGTLLILAISAVLMLPGLLAGPSLDAAVFQVIGRQLAEGGVIYVDAWDHKPPGIHAIHAVAALIPGQDSWAAAWVMTVGASGGAAVVVWRTLRQHVGRFAALVAGIACAVVSGHYLLALGGGMSESFALLPAAAAVSVLARPATGTRHAILAGGLAAAAVVISPQLASAALAGLVLLFWSGRPSRSVTGFVVAGAAVAASVVGLMAAVGALEPFLDAVVTYNAAYRQSTAGGLSGPAFSLVPWVTLALVVLIAPAAAGAIAARRRSTAVRGLTAASLAWILAACGLILVQGRMYGHYGLSIVVPLSLLAGIGFDDAWRSLRTARRRSVGVGVIATLALLSLGVGAVGARMELERTQASNARAMSVGDWIEAMRIPAQHILVWGNEPQVHWRTQIPPATRYSYLYPITTRGYATPAIIDRTLAELRANPPELVVDAGSPRVGAAGFLPLLRDRPVATDGRDLDLLDPIRAFVGRHYDPAIELDGWLIYRLRR